MAKVDYGKAFPDDSVKHMRIVVSQKNWDAMKKDMTEKLGEFGAFNDGGNIDTMANDPLINDSTFNDSTSGGDDDFDMVDGKPVWVHAEMQADGYSWKDVGLRFKGNSSLAFAWSSGDKKLPFRINMDKFEDESPSTKNQRYWGFKRLAFSNNNGDFTNVREKVASELFEDAGIPVARSALVKLTLVHGDSVDELGIYTMTEIPGKPMLNKYYANSKGSLFKPLSKLSAYNASEFPSDETSPSSASVVRLIRILQDSLRLQKPSAWRDSLESSLNVKGFLSFLAANKAIDNWDSYGTMAHNYYLYDNNGVLQWIPWDLGLSLGASIGGADSAGVDSISASQGVEKDGFIEDSLSQFAAAYYEDVSEEWPLIHYVLSDSLYRAFYANEVKRILQGPLSASAYQATVDNYADLVEPYVDSPNFSEHVKSLREYMSSRISTLLSSLEIPEEYRN
jgi:spore coat protein H